MSEICNRVSCQDSLNVFIKQNDFGTEPEKIKRTIVDFLVTRHRNCPDVLCCPLVVMELWQIRTRQKDQSK